MKTIVPALLLSVLLGSVGAQEKTVPVGEEGHHQLVLENEYTRVFHVVVNPKDSTLMHQHDRDYVYVMIGSSQVQATKLGAAPIEMKLNDGDVKFTKAPITHKVTNVGDTPFVNLTIEVKKESTRAVCGASWAGQGPTGTICGGGGGGTSGGASWSRVRALETDAVVADSVTSMGQYSVQFFPGSHPILLVPITPVVTNEITKTNKSITETAGPDRNLDSGSVHWIPANEQVLVISPRGKQARFVLVEFR